MVAEQAREHRGQGFFLHDIVSVAKGCNVTSLRLSRTFFGPIGLRELFFRFPMADFTGSSRLQTRL
jgi:hypothetical protein